MEWWKKHDNLIALARFIENQDSFIDIDQVIDFFEKPWKWEDAWQDYLEKSEA